MTVAAAWGDLGQTWGRRRPERLLLLGCLFCIGIGFLLVAGSSHADKGPVAFSDFLPLLVYALSLTTVHLALVLFRFRGDQVLVATTAFLAGFGLLAQTRMGAFELSTGASLSLYVFPAGMLIMVVTTTALMRGRYRALAAGIWFWAAVSLIVVAALLLTGQRFRGGVYGAGYVTPTEMLKVTVVLFAAAYIDRYGRSLGAWSAYGLLPPWRTLAPLAGVFAALVVLLLYQRDLGMVLMLTTTLVAMLILGTGRMGYLFYGIMAAAALGHLALSLFRHGQRRIDAWRQPFEDPTGDGWQILQGLSGMYSGGLWGEGFGEGNPEYTPIAESDFIYSVIGEELGFLGCALVLSFFLLFFFRGLQVADRSRSNFGLLLCGGLITIIATQTFLNIGGVTKFIPLTGITLPFISHGGSSLLTGFAALGLLLAVSDGEKHHNGPSGRPSRSPRTRAGGPRRPDRPQSHSRRSRERG